MDDIDETRKRSEMGKTREGKRSKEKVKYFTTPRKNRKRRRKEEEGQARIPTKSRPEQSEKVLPQYKNARRKQLILRIT